MNKSGKRCSHGIPSPPPNPLRCWELSTSLGMCRALGRPHQGLPSWHGVFFLIWFRGWAGVLFFFFFFFDRWNEQYTLLLSIFPHCQWLTKAAQKNVAWRKAAAAWRGRRSHLGQNIAPCLHGLKGPSSWQNNSAGKALNTNFFTEDKRPLSNFVWQSHSSRGD